MKNYTHLLAALLLVAAACGDDDGAAAPANHENAEFCEAYVDFAEEAMEDLDVDWETATEEDIELATQQQAQGLLDDLDRVEALAPPDARASLEPFATKMRRAAEGEDLDQVETFETFEQYGAGALGAAEHCPWDRAEAFGHDHRFEGMPDTMEAGVALFRLTNEGSEIHEMSVFRLADDFDGTAEDFAALGPEEAYGHGEQIAHAFTLPGTEVAVLGDLTPGRYVAVCFIPVGATSIEDEWPEDGPSHAEEGMYTGFAVD